MDSTAQCRHRWMGAVPTASEYKKISVSPPFFLPNFVPSFPSLISHLFFLSLLSLDAFPALFLDSAQLTTPSLPLLSSASFRHHQPPSSQHQAQRTSPPPPLSRCTTISVFASIPPRLLSFPPSLHISPISALSSSSLSNLPPGSRSHPLLLPTLLYNTMTSNQKVSSIIVECKSQEQLDQLIAINRRVIVLYYSYAMP